MLSHLTSQHDVKKYDNILLNTKKQTILLAHMIFNKSDEKRAIMIFSNSYVSNGYVLM